jgi:hypothetical protein
MKDFLRQHELIKNHRQLPTILKQKILTPKGLLVPDMEFRDFGQAVVNEIKFWIF